MIIYSRILANRPMIKIDGKVHYLSSGTSMLHAAGGVVALFENTWMRACGVGAMENDGSRKINKMGNIELLLDVDEDRREFDSAVISTIRRALPEFDEHALCLFYEELKKITHEDDSMVRRGVSASLGKIAAEDLLLCGALSINSPFFSATTVGKEIRKKGIEKYGIIRISEELDINNNLIRVNYPEASDPEFKLLTDEHLPNNHLPASPNTWEMNPVVNTHNRYHSEDSDRLSRLVPENTTMKDGISKQELYEILKSYQSTSFMGFLGSLWLFSYLISPYRSQAMIQLNLLVHSHKDTITCKEISTAIGMDDDSIRRLSLFNRKGTSNGTGTDKIITKIDRALR